MDEKIIKTRIVHKHDTEANWNKVADFIPKLGEIIVYDVDDEYSYERVKIGDGENVVSALPFSTDGLKEYLESQISGISELVGDTAVSEQIAEAIINKANKEHSHDDIYYTEEEIDNMLNHKQDSLIGTEGQFVQFNTLNQLVAIDFAEIAEKEISNLFL